MRATNHVRPKSIALRTTSGAPGHGPQHQALPQAPTLKTPFELLGAAADQNQPACFAAAHPLLHIAANMRASSSSWPGEAAARQAEGIAAEVLAWSPGGNGRTACLTASAPIAMPSQARWPGPDRIGLPPQASRNPKASASGRMPICTSSKDQQDVALNRRAWRTRRKKAGSPGLTPLHLPGARASRSYPGATGFGFGKVKSLKSLSRCKEKRILPPSSSKALGSG